jgi:hypothetical protein
MLMAAIFIGCDARFEHRCGEPWKRDMFCSKNVLTVDRSLRPSLHQLDCSLDNEFRHGTLSTSSRIHSNV